MVYVVFSSNPRVEVDGSKTIKDAIDLVKPPGDHKRVAVFFRGNKLSDEQVIGNITGLKPHHSLRVLYDVTQQESDPMDTNTIDNQLLQSLENTSEAELQKISDIISKLDFKRTFALKNPKITDNPILINLLADFTQWKEGIKRYPELVPYIRQVLDNALPKDTFGRLFNPAGPSLTRPQPNLFGAPQPPNRITAESLQDAFASVMNNLSAPTAAAPSVLVPPAPQIPPPATPENPLERFRSQLDQFHEFGFFDDDENVQYLVVTNGNFEAALELLIRSREE
ncbi:unnamed protein product [Bursaphelenchus xylophilus]|uniref:(pine wood nematode) hypothetical protein n=1 Tax=Bursaphelenchus xylophilus TaxID=6326 RepID=A0A1I7RVA8_BURXY|nr:unnamed protein product [Bursaphelenchus xylophilus]CAG9086620.1 unnamed protein product [Bursaphelenchus xylophilus]